MRFEINNRKNTGKLTVCGNETILLSKQQVKKNHKGNYKKENKNITCTWETVKAVLREIYNCKGLNFKKRKSLR